MAGTLYDVQVLQQLGRLPEAIALCARIAKASRKDFHANFMLGGLYAQTGNIEKAATFFRYAVEASPENLDAKFNLAYALNLLDDDLGAIKLYKDVLSVQKSHYGALLNTANSLGKIGQHPEALTYYDQLIAMNPASSDVYCSRGASLCAVSRLDEALADYGKAIAIKPDYAEAYYNRAITLNKLKRFDEALADNEKAVSLKPDYAAAIFNLGLTLNKLKRFGDAVASYDRAISLKRNYVEAYYNRGIALHELRQFDEALANYDKTIALRRDHAEAYNSRGVALHEMGRFADALTSYGKAIALRPDDAGIYFNRGVAFHELRKFDEALASYDKTVALAPDHAEAFFSRGTALKEVRRFEDALASFKAGLELEWAGSQIDEAHKALLLDIVSIDLIPAMFVSQEELNATFETLAQKLRHCLQSMDSAEGPLRSLQPVLNRILFHLDGFFIAYLQKNAVDVMKDYARLVSRLLGVTDSTTPRQSRRAGRIRLGVASALLKHHNGTAWAYDWLSKLPNDYEFFTYAFNPDADHVTQKFRELGTHRSLRFDRDTFQSTIEAMREDELDILMLPDVGMTAASRILASHRIAPVQFTAWGHPITTGSPEIDYYLSSDLMEPEDAPSHYSETLVRLPNLALFLTPPAPSKTTLQKFPLPEGRTLYGCLQSLFKYLPKYDHVYPLIAKQVPTAFFVFLEGVPSYTTAILKERLARSFAEYGLDVDAHVKILPRQTHEGYSALVGQMDVLLDSIGWTGGNTSLQAIEMGKPIVTIPGAFMRGRHTHAMLRMLGLEQYVAASLDDYISRAAELGRDADLRTAFRNDLLARKERLYGDQGFITALDDFLKLAVSSQAQH